MSNIIGISGSLRRGSFNTGLLRAAQSLFPGQIELATIRGIPLYDADVEAQEGVPQLVEELKDQIAGADGVLIATPEYNNSIPGVFKNAIDWLSRPPADIPRVFHAKAIAVLGASPGGFGTILAQNDWLALLRTLRTRPWLEGRLLVSRAQSLFDPKGDLTDDKTREQLQAFVGGFIEFARRQRSSAATPEP